MLFFGFPAFTQFSLNPSSGSDAAETTEKTEGMRGRPACSSRGEGGWLRSVLQGVWTCSSHWVVWLVVCRTPYLEKKGVRILTNRMSTSSSKDQERWFLKTLWQDYSIVLGCTGTHKIFNFWVKWGERWHEMTTYMCNERLQPMFVTALFVILSVLAAALQ